MYRSVHSLLLSAATASTLVLAVPAAQAANFDFESIAPPAFTAPPVPAGYADATWSGFVLRRSSDFTGGTNGFVLNGTTMALADAATPTITFAAPTVYEGAYLGINSVAGASTISYSLWLGPTLVASSGVLGFNAGFLASSYSGPIDKIVFQEGNGDRLSLDSLAMSAPVPEPASLALLAGGLMVVVGAATRRR